MMEALGRLFDVGTGWTPVDLDTSNGATGKRISLANAAGITFLVFVGAAASGTDDVTLDVQQHTAYTGGTSGDLDVVTQYYIKSETLLDNDESWVKVTQAAASEVTLAGATYAAKEKIVAIHVGADQLTDGYTHVSLVASVATSASQLGACLYLLHDMRAGRTPANLGNLLNPGAANA
jgi:hypothetical protein